MTRQFNICELRRDAGPATHVVVLQHDELSDIRTVIVAPLYQQLSKQLKDEKRPRWHPRIQFNDQVLVLMMERLAAVDRREVG